MKSLPFQDSALRWPLIITTVLVFIVFCWLCWGKFGGNITGFFRIGDVLPLSPYLNRDRIFIYDNQVGYDGQQFLSLSLDPFVNHSDTLVALDNPKYRYRRILYPLLGYLFSFGQRPLIPYILVFINGISLILITYLTSLYFKAKNIPTWQALGILMIPGYWITFSLSTADLLSSVFLMLGLYGYQQKRPIITTTALSLGCLTRETLLLVWLATVLVSYWQKNWQQIKYLIIGILPVLAWNIGVVVRFADQGSYGTGNFDYPWMGLFEKIRTFLGSPLDGTQLFELYLFTLLICCFVVIVINGIKHWKENQITATTTGFYAALFCLSSIVILGYYLDYSRVYVDVYLMCLLTVGLFRIKLAIFAASGLASFAFLILSS